MLDQFRDRDESVAAWRRECHTAIVVCMVRSALGEDTAVGAATRRLGALLWLDRSTELALRLPESSCRVSPGERQGVSTKMPLTVPAVVSVLARFMDLVAAQPVIVNDAHAASTSHNSDYL